MIRIGVDLGGTKIEAIAINDSGEILARRRTDTPLDYQGTLDSIATLVAELEASAGRRNSCVGLGHPGSTSPRNGLMRNANSVWLNGKPLAADLQQRLQRPLRTANDADCFALSEAVDGAGQDAHIVFGVILGTGVGGGIAIGNHLLSGAQKIAGEWGHNPLPWPEPAESPGPECWCGQRGCIETWLSGPGMARDHENRFGMAMSAKEIFATAAQGDPDTRSSTELYVGRLSRALAGVINVIDPDVIVLGGGLSNIDGLAQQVEAGLGDHVFSDHIATRIVTNSHGDSSGVRGAAWLWQPGETS